MLTLTVQDLQKWDGYSFYSHSLSPLTTSNPFSDRLMQIGLKNGKSLQKLPLPIALADKTLLMYTEKKNGVKTGFSLKLLVTFTID